MTTEGCRRLWTLWTSSSCVQCRRRAPEVRPTDAADAAERRADLRLSGPPGYETDMGHVRWLEGRAGLANDGDGGDDDDDRPTAVFLDGAFWSPPTPLTPLGPEYASPPLFADETLVCHYS